LSNPDVGAVTSLGSESVAEDIVEDSVLRKQTMCCAKVVLIPRKVEWCQLIFCYSPLSDDLRPMEVIVGHCKYSGKLHDSQFKQVAFNAEI
jgi:hypothetical protein